MPGPPPKRLMFGAVFLAWLITMSVLAVRHYYPFQHAREAASPAVLPEELFGEHWMGIYYKGNKIG